ncbi:uncharacterized protein LOC121869594 [Homarus americanus]|nr:uncharacterized protein LOC121869594 [Homarus americanus]
MSGDDKSAGEEVKAGGDDSKAVPLTPSITIPILQLSQEEEGYIPSAQGEPITDTPSSSVPAGSPQKVLPLPPSSPHPSKRKSSVLEDSSAASESPKIPFKLRRTEDTSETSESGDDRVIVDYTSLAKKGVEISPKQQKYPLRTTKPPHLTGVAKCLTFKDSSFVEKLQEPVSLPGNTEEESSEQEKRPELLRRLPVDTEEEESSEQEKRPELLRRLPVDTEEEESSEQEKRPELPRRLPVDTEEEESSDKEEGKSLLERIPTHTEKSSDRGLKFARRSIPMPERRHSSPEEEEPQISDKEDSDIEIIEDKERLHRSIEIVYEKPKDHSSLDEEVGSQDFSLMLSCTQRESDYTVEEAGQRFSQEPLFSEEPLLEKESQSLLTMSESEHLKCHDTLSSSSDEESKKSVEDDGGSMRATQLERICRPASLTQPDVKPLITLPISSTESKEKQSYAHKDITSASKTDKDVEMKGAGSDDDAESSGKMTASTSKVQSSTVGVSPRASSRSSQVETRLQMPDISTPPLQYTQGSQESESVFVKASKAAKERIQIEEKRIEAKKKERKESEFDISGESSPGLLDASKEETQDSRVTEKSIIDCDVTKESSSNVSTPMSDLMPSHSSQSTPVTSQSHWRPSQSTTLFSSGKKEGILSTSSTQGSPKILAEETDSEEEGPVHRKRKKLRPSEKLTKAISSLKTEERKSSTPNTSQGISLNISSEGVSYIDKEAQGVLSGIESSKSHNTSPEEGITSKFPDSVRSLERAASTADTELLPDLNKISTIEDLIKYGFRQHRTLETVEYMHPLTRDLMHVTFDGDKAGISKINFHSVTDTGSGSGRSGRTSDASSISRLTGSSGYLGDKSSSSSNSSRRMSAWSTTESSRLSIASVVTLSSPPRVTENKEEGSQKGLPDDGIFVIPAARPKTQVSGKGTETSPRASDYSSPSKLKRLPTSALLEQMETTLASSDEMPTVTVERRGQGRARGRPRTRGSKRGGGQGTPSKSTPRRGRGRGRGRGVITKPKKLDEDSECDGEPPETINPVAGASLVAKTEEAQEKKTAEAQEKKTADPVLDLFDSLHPEVWKMLENSQFPLSEEEEEAFVGQGGADAEKQLDQVLKRVREAELEAGLLVFARFTDNNFYSAVLTERHGADRWHVQFTLDQYSASVREVYLLPTDLLPRGQTCYVRQQTEHYCDSGVVIGHVRVGPTVLHIVETDRGLIQRIPHSHLLLTGSQANDILQARLAFRSLVASPGRDISLDNIVAGRRRRIQPEQFSSPRSNKADDNLDSSEATVGESEDFVPAKGRSPSTKRGGVSKGSRKQELPILQEESENESETAYKVTPRGRRRPGTPRSSRTPRAPRTPRTPRTSQSETVPPDDTSLEKELLTSKLQAETAVPLPVAALQTSEVPLTPPKKRGRQPGQSSSTQTPTKLSKLEDVPPDPKLGPLPPQDSRLFEGYTILLTSGNSSIKKRQGENCEDLPPFDKDHLTNQIIIGGGRVLEKYSEAEIILAEQGRFCKGGRATPSKAKKKSATASTTLLLISNTHCRTAKFIQCLAAGIPIVSFQWVITSCCEKKIRSWRNFMLPSGENDSGEQLEQELGDADGPMGPQQLLTGERIFLGTSTNAEFSPLWQPLLDTIGAKVRVKPARSGNLNRVLDKSITVVIGDPTIPEEEVQRAEQLGVPLLATEWVIQSLTAGRRLSYTAHSKFRLNVRGPATGSKEEGN